MDNFIVSARKYRPSTFQTVVGQQHITSTLRNAIERNQLAHAYLFCGPRGVGKTTCARIFAKAINCLAPRDNDACGECESCVSFGEGRSLNIHELDAASNNSVDDIRTLTDQVRIPPQIGKYSVYIIDEVHMLSAQAFNAFLKTLEEPPAHAIFVLATTEKHKIIPTILSRCQIFDFNRIRVEDGVKYLEYIASKQGVSYDDESLHLIARKADGSMRDALSMFDKAVSFCGNELHFKRVAETLNVLDYDTYFSMVAAILKGEYPAVLGLFDTILSSGFSGQSFIGGLNSHFRDLLMCKEPYTITLLEVTGTLLDSYREQSKLCDVEFLFGAISLLTEIDSSLRVATNQRLNIELGLMKLCGLSQKKKLIPSQSHPLPDLQPPAPTAERIDAGLASPRTQSDPKSGEALADKSDSDAKTEVVEERSPNTPTPTPEQNSSKAEGLSSSPTEAKVKIEPETAQVKETVERPSTPPRNTIIGSITSISGPSIADLMGSELGDEPLEADESLNGELEQMSGADDDAGTLSQDQAKLLEIRDEFIETLNRKRPRIAMAFHSMQVSGREISISVPTQELYEEIMRNRAEIGYILSDLVDLSGGVRFKVEISESSAEKLPMKFEDKLQYLTDKNPHLTLLRQRLELTE